MANDMFWDEGPVKYGYDASSEESISQRFDQKPEIYLVVLDYAYFADSSGYVMMCPIEAIESKICGEDDFGAVNAKWDDEQQYAVDVPNDVLVEMKAVCNALTALHKLTPRAE